MKNSKSSIFSIQLPYIQEQVEFAMRNGLFRKAWAAHCDIDGDL